MTRFRFGKGPSNNERFDPQQRDYDKISLGRPSPTQRDYDRSTAGNHPSQREYDRVNFGRNNPEQFNDSYDNEDFYDPQEQQNFDPRQINRHPQDQYYQQRQQPEGFVPPPPPQHFQSQQSMGSARPYTRQMMPTQRAQDFRNWQDNDEYYESSRDPEQWSDRPSPMRFIVAISGLILIAAISWFAYRWASSTSGEPPTISPELGPFKVRPEHPGGIVIPHQDKLIYDRISSNSPQTVERLLPPPDQTVASTQRQQQTPQHQPDTEGEGVVSSQGSPYAQPNPQNSQAYLQQPQASPKVEHLMPPQGQIQRGVPHSAALPHDGTAYSPQRQQQQPHSQQEIPSREQHDGSSASMQTSKQKISSPAEYPIKAEKPAAVITEANQDDLKKILSDTVEQIKPKEKEVQSALPVTGLKPLQGYFVQLATLPNEHSAQIEWKRLKDRYSQELKGVTWHIRPYNMTNGKKYRILIGPFKNKLSGQSKCQQLGVVCRVIQLP